MTNLNDFLQYIIPLFTQKFQQLQHPLTHMDLETQLVIQITSLMAVTGMGDNLHKKIRGDQKWETMDKYKQNANLGNSSCSYKNFYQAKTVVSIYIYTELFSSQNCTVHHHFNRIANCTASQNLRGSCDVISHVTI